MKSKGLLVAGIATAVVGLYLITWYVVRPTTPAPQSKTPVAPPPQTGKKTNPHQSLPVLPDWPDEARTGIGTRQSGGSKSNSLPGILAAVAQGKGGTVSAADIEAYLTSKKRNAASLIAAWQVSKNKDYLREAAKQFPNDPQLQYEVLANDAFPEERAQWIARFKESSPYNPLAYYFSAAELLRQKQTDAALQELVTGSTKPQYEDYAGAALRERENVFVAGGEQELAAKTIAFSGMALPQLEILRSLAKDAAALQADYAASGDQASAQNVASAIVMMGQHLGVSTGGRPLITQLVGSAIERTALEKLDQNQKYDWLGQTPAERIAQLNRSKEQIRRSTADWEKLQANLNDADAAMYFELVKSSGEYEAMRWVAERLKD